MKREFVWTKRFLKGWADCSMRDEDLIVLEYILLSDPKIGKVIPEMDGVRKLRFAFKDTGKRGAMRVIYIDLEISEKIVALDAFQKNDKADLTSDDKKDIRRMVKEIRTDYGKDD